MRKQIKAKPSKATPKPKPKAKRGITPLQVEHAQLPDERKAELDKLIPVRLCYVCDRTSRELLRIGPTKFRCEDCNPGSPNWADYWERLHADYKTDAGQMLYDNMRRAR